MLFATATLDIVHANEVEFILCSIGLLDCFNAQKCKQMVVSRKRNRTPVPPIKVADKPLEIVMHNKILGRLDHE